MGVLYLLLFNFLLFFFVTWCSRTCGNRLTIFSGRQSPQLTSTTATTFVFFPFRWLLPLVFKSPRVVRPLLRVVEVTTADCLPLVLLGVTSTSIIPPPSSSSRLLPLPHPLLLFFIRVFLVLVFLVVCVYSFGFNLNFVYWG